MMKDKQGFQMLGKMRVVWQVIQYDEDENEVVAARFKDATKAAEYVQAKALWCGGVQMSLHRPEWNTQTED